MRKHTTFRFTIYGWALGLAVSFFALGIHGCKKNPRSTLSIEVRSPLIFKTDKEVILESSAHDLAKEVRPQNISLYDLHYLTNKNYLAFPFVSVLQTVYGQSISDSKELSLVFRATDGYEAVINTSRFNEGQAFLAFQDLDHSGWSALPNHGGETAGPYYLVWEDTINTAQKGFPWPWAIEEIIMVNRDLRYKAIVPDSSITNNDIDQGFDIFMSRCTSCHALDGYGGTIGPDLNSPQNILTYRTEHMVREMILHPSKYRTGKMPDFVDLKGESLDHLISYLSYLRDRE